MIFRIKISTISWILFGVSLANYVFGVHYFLKRSFRFKNDEHEQNRSTYSSSRLQFTAEYDRCNPVTQAKASQEFIEYLKSKGNFKFLDYDPELTKKLALNLTRLGIKSDLNTEGSGIGKLNTMMGIANGLDMYANQSVGLSDIGR